MTSEFLIEGGGLQILIDLFHPCGVFVVTLKWGHLVNVVGISLSGGVVFVDAQTQLDHPVDAVGVSGRVLEGEAGGEEGSFEQQQDKVLD